MPRTLSIWFFVGLALAGNGALILGAGLLAWRRPPPAGVVLASLHANLWWGGLLLALGLLYCLRFGPRRER